MQSRDLASVSGVTAQTIRFNKRRGLLPPAARDRNGYRRYDEVALSRLQFIRSAQTAALTLTEISSITFDKQVTCPVSTSPASSSPNLRTCTVGKENSCSSRQSCTTCSAQARISTRPTAKQAASATSSRRVSPRIRAGMAWIECDALHPTRPVRRSARTWCARLCTVYCVEIGLGGSRSMLGSLPRRAMQLRSQLATPGVLVRPSWSTREWAWPRKTQSVASRGSIVPGQHRCSAGSRSRPTRPPARRRVRTVR
ncbi:MerR family transcriptional regulator [Cryobacterium sp. TMT3-29-2]|uniref:MerR family transcriptional regulator n=1 Tax=Cryobacterium sp. TMT3-29-2 TaxID=2555867 RepID=UPI001F5401E7|nr:MerR family transcriptional regulator [Cryobacterium sp. TMT3-29-2]